jgi:DNA repair protein RadC
MINWRGCPGCRARTLAKEAGGGKLLVSSDVIANLFRLMIGPSAEQEHFVVFTMNIRNVMVGADVIGKGTAFSVQVEPRDVFRYAIRTNAVGIVMAHNHPSGDCAPSAEDIVLTRRLVEAGKLLGIPILDHVVITDTRFHSIMEML